jgi:hypothetical protein
MSSYLDIKYFIELQFQGVFLSIMVNNDSIYITLP